MVKQWLADYVSLSQEISLDIERIEFLRNKLFSAATAKTDKTRVNTGCVNDIVGTGVVNLTELENRTREKISAAASYAADIESALQLLTGRNSPFLRAVIRSRYLDLCTWAQINRQLFGNEPDFEQREDSFLRRTTKLHGRALELLAELHAAGQLEAVTKP